ncbi:MAG: nucleotidyltransferase domain-containing protein [Clostridia bacterium]|nr:nucleotidyltransferase domain-containing protein [Clostridia bacterium]
MTELKLLRMKSRLTQKEAAQKIGISLRSYVSYENEDALSKTPKYRFLLAEMNELVRLDEEHGILTVDEIKTICSGILKDYPVQYCYLFGSYAKGTASPASDVDLLVSSEITGLRFYELTEKLREALHKKIDLLDVKQLAGNEELLNEVLRDGVKIYGQCKK